MLTGNNTEINSRALRGFSIHLQQTKQPQFSRFILRWRTRLEVRDSVVYAAMRSTCSSGRPRLSATALVSAQSSVTSRLPMLLEYGKFNNVIAVLSKHSNVMSTLHLVKSYCLPALLYGSEVWHLNDNNMQKISVTWNNCFRCTFSCCRRESVKPLQYFCRTLPISYLLHQRKLL